ncbi:DUF4199 domain-containing protein [Bernardetia sp. ABR2-2B]|uniref:DUF4199 domain-containing protein n=1 Tax=Bernardetia sp. ABR2-2B TaxID=3127472 RepID=UPI0030CB963B
MKYLTKHEFKWAFIFIIVFLLWMVFEKLMGWHAENIASHMVMTNIFAAFAIAVYVFALLEKRKKYYLNSMTWKEGFMSGLMITIIVTLFAPFSQLIVSLLISPEYFPNVIKYSVETGYYKTVEEAEAYFNLKSYIIQSILGTLIMGVITSAIVALFVRRK